MKLIGMLDSPYVRRVAISLELYGVDFVHEPLSVFRTFTEFSQINPVVKAPTLVLDDGTVLMDSSLILDYLETLAPADKKLLPSQPAARARDLQTLGLALAACEKSVQIVYEHNLRPAEKLHAPWLDRVSGQLLAAYSLLEKQLSDSEALSQASITAAVAWSFSQFTVASVVKADAFPNLKRHAERLEQHPAFKKYPIE
ncbi:glutathione S-transferase family protein [Pseudomonas marginalis]|jgi:glutathione S-transferase|uniref:Glutathione S-transferase n=4 Tax=Pseudomonas fluorescens group TaxID=136843 RepID=C3K975_PSEFS|nr:MULTISPECIES: glutathione S-transferase family protein [Pseudomonas fluorescens group]KJZ53154.1 glutathione S-transferase [Pseudomonas marginalis]MBZ6464134.1 glutathione S-transferase family protein [Pseudomonas fluorescens group sp.]MBZ6470170.1 glutathione S-transferase family protein [Pseudomonas fluorescens group sp.]MCD7038797.1 glutathione S-transferase family protein [Pseudomonas petroselini]MCD7046395.1 glutathione S-transferase family protein [Pseudomonas petroselini]